MTAAAILIAVVLDRFIGDPPHWPHPVKWMGALIAFLDRHLNRGSLLFWKGLLMTAAVVGVTGCVSFFFVMIATRVHPAAGVMAHAVLIWSAISPRSLKEAALAVYEPLQKGDMTEARHKLSWIVGRDTAGLPESDIVRGTVETVAENTSDGVIAPLFWAVIGGGPAAVMYRAVNTCDSMVGYRNERYKQFGKASARLDDVVNWVPARLSALLLITASGKPEHVRKKAWQIVRRDAKKHPSPNSGWGESAVAGLLSIQLGGLNTYGGIVSDRARMGDNEVPRASRHITESAQLMERATYAFVILYGTGVMLYELAFSWSQSGSFI